MHEAVNLSYLRSRVRIWRGNGVVAVELLPLARSIAEDILLNNRKKTLGLERKGGELQLSNGPVERHGAIFWMYHQVVGWLQLYHHFQLCQKD